MTVSSPDLKDWSKKDLMREVARLRALLHEHSTRRGGDARERSTDGAIIGGTPHGQGDALLDARSAVLLDGVEVVLVDSKGEDPLAMMLVLKGRINYSEDRVEHAYLYGPDGAAAIVVEHIALAKRAEGIHGHGQRFSKEFAQTLDERVEEL